MTQETRPSPPELPDLLRRIAAELEQVPPACRPLLVDVDGDILTLEFERLN